MVAFYIRRIQNGLMELEDVPLLWKSRVAAALSEKEESGETDGRAEE